MMEGRYQAYPGYKDSGVEWLGGVPEHWNKSKVKFHCSVKGRIGFRGYTVEDLVEKEKGALVIGASEINSKGEIMLNNPQYISWEKYYESPEIMLSEGMVLVVQRGSVGKIAYVPNKLGKATINPSLIVLRDLTVNPMYMTYSLMGAAIQNLVIMQTSTTAVPMISQEQVGNYWLLAPSIKEQTQIANFLDHETAKIDTLIEKQQQLIKLLKEKRQAVISHAVTKGLNPDAPMRDSGVEWLGEIPHHWKMVRLSFVLKLQSGDTITSNSIEKTGEYPVYGGNGLRGYTSGYNCNGEYVLIGRQGALCGNINIASSKFYASEHAIVVYPRQFFNTVYLAEMLRFMDLGQYSFSAAQPGVSVERLNLLKVILPPDGEQVENANFIVKEVSKFDTLSMQSENMISLLKERRTALISAAVTGKIDVRNWQAPEQKQTNKEDAA